MSTPVFTLTVMDDGDVLINNLLPAFPITDLVRLLRQVADGFERGDATRVDA